MYSNNIVNFQESTAILNACTKKSGNILNSTRIYRPSLDDCYIQYASKNFELYIWFKLLLFINELLNTI